MYIDDKIAEILVDNLPILEHIHPNYISLTGFFLNIIIAYNLFTFNYGPLLLICIILRCLMDILDGAVARKYSKVTYVGGLLDTFTDCSLIIIIFYYFILLLDLPNYLILLPISIIIGTAVVTESYSDHSSLKIYGNGSLKDLMAFLINNTCITFAGLFSFFFYKYISINESIEEKSKIIV
jgi:phosphatidylglycerophosphate synthase